MLQFLVAARNNLYENTVRFSLKMSIRTAVNDIAHGLTDGELITIAVKGRVDGFEELVRRYQRPITGYVFRMLGDYESSLDVTQEVFIKVYNSLTKYSPEYKFSTWLYRIRSQRSHRPHAAKLRNCSKPRGREFGWKLSDPNRELSPVAGTGP